MSHVDMWRKLEHYLRSWELWLDVGWMVITLTRCDLSWHHDLQMGMWDWEIIGSRIVLDIWAALTIQVIIHYHGMWGNVTLCFTDCRALAISCNVESCLNLERLIIRFIIKDGNSNLNIPARWGQADIMLADARSDCSLTFLAARWLWLQPSQANSSPSHQHSSIISTLLLLHI